MSQPPDMTRVHKVEIVISTLLRIGVVTSLSIVLLGTAISFLRHPDYKSSHDELKRLISPKADFPHDIKDTMHGLRSFEGRSIIIVGLLLLIATPVMRVAISIFAFVYQDDPTFIVVTSVVLILLLLSFVLGKAGG